MSGSGTGTPVTPVPTITAKTFGGMQARIADELARADLGTQIQFAILSAIEYYKDDRFWFNEGEVSFYPTDDGLITGTLAGHSPMPVTFGEIDEATVTVAGSNRYRIVPVSYEFIRDNIIQNTSAGWPGWYTIFEEDIWYYPISDSLYPITLSGLIYFTTLSDSTDTNAWMNEAERLIRYRAKADIFASVTRNDKEAQKMAIMEEQELGKLKQKMVQKVSSGRLKSRVF